MRVRACCCHLVTNISTSLPHRSSSDLAKRPSHLGDKATVGAATLHCVAELQSENSHVKKPGHRRHVSSGGRLENVVPDLTTPLSPSSSSSQRRHRQSVRKPASLHPLMDEDDMSDESTSEEEDQEVLSPQQLLARNLSSTMSAKSSTSLPPPSADRVRGLLTSWCTPEELEAAETMHIKLQSIIGLIQSYIGKTRLCVLGCVMRNHMRYKFIPF